MDAVKLNSLRTIKMCNYAVSHPAQRTPTQCTSLFTVNKWHRAYVDMGDRIKHCHEHRERSTMECALCRTVLMQCAGKKDSFSSFHSSYKERIWRFKGTVGKLNFGHINKIVRLLLIQFHQYSVGEHELCVLYLHRDKSAKGVYSVLKCSVHEHIQ